jgi:hypothetical protein
MTDIEVLLSNLGVTFARLCTSAIGIWAFYYFVKTIFGEGGRNPVKIGLALAVIAGAGAGYKMIPTLLQAGENTGAQMGGSSGGSYSMPPLGTLPSDIDTLTTEQAAFTPAAITATLPAQPVFVSVGAADTVQLAAA